MKAFFSFLFSLRTLILLVLLAALATGGVYLYYWQVASNAGPGFRTEPVTRRKLTATISATGTIEPEEVIDVGAQVQGRIEKFGDDPNDSSRPIDYCTRVKQGTVLAVIDKTVYQSHVDQVTAALKNAQAQLDLATANRWKAEQDLKRADREVAAGHSSLAASDYDTFAAVSKTTAASVKVAEAAVGQAEANLKEAQTNLDYCTIQAPVDGVIVDRRVNVGQTVVASLSAPSLFLLAKDLTRMQVWASVNEADIGNIHVGQDVTFTVDARPGETFRGSVAQIRYNATMTQNVVTYTVVVSTTNKVVDNPVPVKVTTPEGRAASSNEELELLPYMTANLTFHVAERTNALLVPNAALRWRPQLTQVAPDARSDYEQTLRKKAAKEEAPEDATAAAPDKGPAKKQGGAASRGMVWVQDGAFVRPIKLQTGLSDGAMTEVVMVRDPDTLDEGTPLVTGENQGKGASATTNPFAPPPIFRPQQPKKQDQ